MKRAKNNAMVPVALPIPQNTELITEADAAKSGVIKFKAVDFNALQKLGIEIENVGIMPIDRGSVFVTKRAAVNCALRLEEMIPDAQGEDIYNIANALAKLLRAVSDSAEINTEKGGGGPTVPPRRAFKLGGTAIFANHVHIEGTEKTTPP